MGAGTSPADGAHADEAVETDEAVAPGGPGDAVVTEGSREAVVTDGPDETAVTDVPAGPSSTDGAHEAPAVASAGGSGSDEAPAVGESDEVPSTGESDKASLAGAGGGGSTRAPSRRFSLTRDTARPEGGGRAAPGDAPAPARQWPLLTVLCTAGVGLLIVGANPFAEAFRIGAMLMGIALLAGAVLRWVVPSVGMLAVRSRFTDLVTYGLMGTLIVLLALMAQPEPWLDVPILEDVVHFTIR
ncbi:DUF3017 domain-containing protein [Streptomyces sp. NPDC060022]|uniref:DUF3017 domain-containing protein n=1 Tax=Streptomyces sp. NPDC060022 TaxID=3347039 RepID=UPI00367DEA35